MRTLLPALTTMLTLFLVVATLMLGMMPRLPEGSTPLEIVAPDDLD
ncbi:MAG TPA: hypothetical protein VFK41_07910 [Nocardioidaceae bacterium]|nr:hypothetical protein [Nocardioidaceae bacterium]